MGRRMRSRTAVLVILGAVLAVAAGTVAARRLSAPRNGTPGPEGEVARLSVPEDRLDLGPVWESDEVYLTLPIENQESGPVEVESFSATCNCLSVEPRSFALRPGERRELRLRLDLTTKQSQGENIGVRLTAKLNPGASGGKRLGPEWRVSGTLRRVLEVEPAVYLGRHSELSAVPPQVVPVRALVPLASLSARSDIPGVDVSVRPPPAGSATHSVVITSTQPTPVGAFEWSITLHPVARSGESLPPRRVGVRGSIVPELDPHPPAIQVGGRRVGEAFEEVVVLRALSGQPLGPVRAEAEGEGLSVEPAGDAQFRVRQSVRRPGTQSTRVRFWTEVAARRVEVVVPVEYAGLEHE
jgi:hypothetical protein